VSLHDSDESTQKAHDQDLVLVMSFLCGLITVMQNKNIYCKLYNDEHSSYHTKTVGSWRGSQLYAGFPQHLFNRFLLAQLS